MNSKIQEQFIKRQSNGPNLRNDLNNQQHMAQAQQQILQQQAAAQQQQQQQQQMLMAAQNPMLQAQLRAFGQNQNFQHLQQHPMQTAISQPPSQMMNGIPIPPNGLQMAPNQPQMQANLMRQGGNPQPVDFGKLTEGDRMRVNELAQRLYLGTDDNSRRQMVASMQNRVNPQTIQNLQRQGKDLVMHLCQIQAFNILTNKAQNMRAQIPGQDANQNRMQLQQKNLPPGMMNPNMMNVSGPAQSVALGAGPAGPAGAGQAGQYPFANMDTIRNEQKAGMMAQEAGQVVVPASNGQPGRNATPQPINGNLGAPGSAPGQNRPGTQQGPNQGQHGPQMQQQFNVSMSMDPVAVNAQNQQRQVGGGPKPMQGQPGMGQSPAMGTMSTPMTRQPTGQADGAVPPQQQPPQTPQQQQQQQLAQASGQFGVQMDPRSISDHLLPFHRISRLPTTAW